ncbi:hypothetical protein FHS18_006014 [Paenibacillus phyllosphaerae]|uniref:Uncharacterized protein n=1 Tax=Paenibacillus phyllosphaerae TaxID=274593 RepID=A0A7W5B3U1_9BACL|nr:hypothetical protein [Paenibacillus phyllosphaerae]MBB3113899.1 hypothetical protein [Paenibacillus phyllosphaerae]
MTEEVKPVLNEEAAEQKQPEIEDIPETLEREDMENVQGGWGAAGGKQSRPKVRTA